MLHFNDRFAINRIELRRHDSRVTNVSCRKAAGREFPARPAYLALLLFGWTRLQFRHLIRWLDLLLFQIFAQLTVRIQLIPT